MKYSQYKDNIIRQKFKKFEYKKRILKTILYSSFVTNQYSKSRAMILLNKLPRSSSIVRIRNRCVLTGRSRSVYRDFKISRIMLKELALNGLMPGVTKSSW